MDRLAMPHQIPMRRHELLQRRVDRVEMDIGDKTVNGRVDRGGLAAM
jgi:hypothetical protein